MALPGYFDDEYESLTSNLAMAPVPPGTLYHGSDIAAVPVAPVGTPYYAYDGSPIGRSQGCEPLPMETQLSGLGAGLTPRMLVPDVLADNRVEMGQQWALPLLAAVSAYAMGASPLMTALWSLGAYMAPLPAAALMAYQLAGAGTHEPVPSY